MPRSLRFAAAFALVTLLVFCVALVLTAAGSADAAPKKKSERAKLEKESGRSKSSGSKDDDNKGANSGAKNVGPDGKRYHEIVDLFLDYGRRYCTALGPLVTRNKHDKGYSWRRRCDVFYEALELFIHGFSDTMVEELDLTQQQMVEQALQPMRLAELKASLKQICKRALEADKTSEKTLQGHLSTKLSQWVMNTAVNKDGNSMGGGMMSGMSLEDMMAQLKNGKKGGGTANGKPKPEVLVTAEDKRWAKEVSSKKYKDDAAKDDPDYMRGGKPGAGAGGAGTQPTMEQLQEQLKRQQKGGGAAGEQDDDDDDDIRDM